MKNRALAYFLFVFFLPSLLNAQPLEQSTAMLSPGRSLEWQTPPGVPVSVSNGAVVRVVDLGNKVRITALRQGTVFLKSGNQSLSLSVVKESTFRLYDQLQSAIKKMRGLELIADKQKIIVSGRLLYFGDWVELSQASLGTNENYEFGAEMDDSLKAEALSYFQKLLRDSDLPDLPLNLGSTALAHVPKSPEDLGNQAARILQPYGFVIVRTSSALTIEPLVRVQILVAEFRRSLNRTFGIEWPASAQAQLLPQLSFPLGGNLLAEIKALESKGLGKILASPTLLCRSGKEAEFLAGGEIPIKVASAKARDVIWKKYGVLLKIKPLADHSGRMSIAIETEVSSPSGQSVDGVPGLLTNRILTHFDLKESRTIALSGLIKKEWGDSLQGLPGVSSLPILGALFSSRSFNEDQTELVIFVTPEIEKGKP